MAFPRRRPLTRPAHRRVRGDLDPVGLGHVVHRVPAQARGLRPQDADAQVIYPKDVGAILVEADIFPGARVLEAGTGSGSLTLALCRAAGSQGRVVSYELRPEFLAYAAQNIDAFFGTTPGWLELREGDVRDVVGENFDRAVFDLPEPWGVLETLQRVLDPGGIVCAYLPTVVQVQRFVLSLHPGEFEHLETFEVLHRSWHVTERSVRPDHNFMASESLPWSENIWPLLVRVSAS